MKPCPVLSSVLAVSLWLAVPASAVTFEWVTVDDPGNACDDEPFQGCFGAVGYVYRIAKYEVTNAQYAEFLNAKAASDPLGLYNASMGSFGGIARSGSDGSYTYSTIAGRENKPVTLVSYFDALRFANWLHNGQGNGDTETGAYTLLGGTPTPSNPLVGRNAGATIFVPTEHEWYKAAYYDPGSGTYFDYPTGTDTQVVCSAPTATPDTANCGGAVGGPTDVGSYPGSPSPNGTFDQGGNVEEWLDGDIVILENRPLRAGAYYSPADRLRKAIQNYDDPWFESGGYGFRVASLADAAICGDAICTGDENPVTCPADCPDVCGDGMCTGGEDLQSCPADCACVTDADCDDGFFCNGEETCSDGACQAGVSIDCNDGVACTIDSCNEETDTCDHAPLDIACDDGSFCNGIETCDATLGCQAGSRPCDDGVSCTYDACYEVGHICTHTPMDAVCDNGLFCDGAEFCDPVLDCQAGLDPCDGAACDEGADTCEDGGGGAALWLSFIDNTAVPGVGTVSDEDIVAYDVNTGTWTLQFDGSDVGLSGFEIDGMEVLPDGDLLLSFTAAGNVPGLAGGPSGNSVDDSDIVRFSPTSLGSTTSGTFTFYFDGSDVGLTSSSESIDGIALAQDGGLILSTTGGFSGSGASGADEDLFVFAASSLGANTAGSFTLLFDGSDVGLTSISENVDAVAGTAAGRFLLSTTGYFGVLQVSGGDEDVLEFAPTQAGPATSGTFLMFLDLSTVGISTSADVGALSLVE